MHLPALILAAALAAGTGNASTTYDPLRVSDARITSQTFEVKDAKRSRTLPIRVYLPASSAPAPVILFSHGLGGSCNNNPYLGNHWAKRGYLVVFVQHPGSDETIWKSLPPLQRKAAMDHAASAKNYILRTRDIPAVLDTLTRWNDDTTHPLHHRLDLDRIGMSGHSFGALTTQSMAGQKSLRNTSFREPRIDAAVMMSPSPPRAGNPAPAFAGIDIPCLLLTGTHDNSPFGKKDAAERLKVFPHLTLAPAWQVVFDQANHMTFGERDLQGKPPRDPRYHRAILALTTAFWDSTLKADPAAKIWLNGKGAKSVLSPDDRWQSNPAASRKSIPAKAADQAS
ncbi:MAG: alpha/beta hydrolase family protein [Verrucomicrobiota bacterium JB025]|nr:dienelactone hydrolase [Verrucomicrobiota bacterium JB025]